MLEKVHSHTNKSTNNNSLNSSGSNHNNIHMHLATIQNSNRSTVNQNSFDEKQKSRQKPQKLSKSKSKQKVKQMNQLDLIQQQQTQRAKIYFDVNLKKQYMRNIVNKYFNPEQTQKNQKSQNTQMRSSSFIHKRKLGYITLQSSKPLNKTIEHGHYKQANKYTKIPQKIRLSQQIVKNPQFKKDYNYNNNSPTSSNQMKFPILKRRSIDIQPSAQLFKSLDNYQNQQENYQSTISRKHYNQQFKASNNVLLRSLNDLRVSQQYKTLAQRESIYHNNEADYHRSHKKKSPIKLNLYKKHEATNLTKSIIFNDNEQSTNHDTQLDIDSYNSSIQFNEPSDLKSFSIGSSMSSIFMKSLPPIHEEYESNFEELTATHPNSYYEQLELSIKQNLSMNQVKTLQTKVFENNSFIIFKIQTQKISTQKPTIKRKEKHFKKLYKPSSIQLLQRQLKAKKIGVDLLWQEMQFQKHCLKVKGYPNLSKILIKISKVQESNQKSHLLIKPRSYHSKLFQDNCKEMLRLIKQICKNLSSVQGKLINNRINLNNIFMVNNYKISIGQWAYSSFRTQYNIQDKQFQKRLTPILKNQLQWFCTPQYLAPQLLKDLSCDTQQNSNKRSSSEEYDAFQHGNVSDVWSLGLLIFQMLTLIPVWIGEKCIVADRKNQKIVPRKGILSVKQRNLKKIIQKQLKIRPVVQKLLNLQCQNLQINQKIIFLIGRMLQPSPQKRITLNEILSFLQDKSQMQQN